VAAVEPERELIRRLTPFAIVAVPLTFVAGLAIGGGGTGASAAIGAAIVAVYFVITAASLAWAAKISPVIVFAVGLGGFVVRIMVFAVCLLLLRQATWFSTLAFIAAFIPWTIALLAAEIKLLSGQMQADMWAFNASGRGQV